MTPTQIAAIKGMLAYFDSGNNIPVDKAVIKGNCAEVAALRAALAETAPVQEPVGWSMTYNGSHVGNFYESRSYAEERMTDLNGKHPDALRTVEPLYAAPQAQQPSPPADMPMLTDEELREAFAQSLTSTYVCGRVWNAWGYGTMSEDDFSPASECDELLDSLVQAVRQKAGLK